MNTSDQAPLWPEDVAQILGVKRSTVTFSASKSKRKGRRARTAVDLPLPAGCRRRTVTTVGGHTRTVVSPWWRPADVEACRQARQDAGLLDVERQPGGQFAKRAG